MTWFSEHSSVADTEPHERKSKLVGGFLLPRICFSNILSAALNSMCNHFGVEVLYSAEVWACRIWLLSQSGYDTLSKIFALTAFWVFFLQLIYDDCLIGGRQLAF